MQLPAFPIPVSGLWAGPAYAGGRYVFYDTNGSIFRRLYGKKSIGGPNAGVLPADFLDAAARYHDLGYEYAERIYGELKELKGT